ncbi:MAG: bifunctional 3-dehydroquinate synthase/phosphatase [Vicingaceae bacterium]
MDKAQLMKFAVIDLGTNTFNLLIIERLNDKFKIVHKQKIPVKLGAEGFEDNLISEAALQRAENALQTYHTYLSKNKVNKVVGFATSGLRSCKNGKAFVDRMNHLFNLNISIIDGDREAELIFKGVKLSMDLKETTLIMDIGGGSTEFIIAQNNEILWKRSFMLGVARLKNLLNPDDPITSNDIVKFHQFLDTALKDLDDSVAKYKPQTLVGCSGSFETLADITLRAFENKKLNKDLVYEINKNQLKEIHKKLLKMNLKERLKVPGMIEMRADLIVLGSLFIQYVLDKYQMDKIILSPNALKEGVIFEIMNA